MKRRLGLLLFAALLTSGCGSFRAPPLPQASSTTAPSPAPESENTWTARVRAADAIYFSLTKSATTSGQPIWQVIQLLQASGQLVALGWAELSATEQPLLEQWQRGEAPATESLPRLLRPERAALLRQSARPDLAQVALGCPHDLLAKIRDGAALSAQEEAELPRDFRPAPEAFEDFADRVAASSRLRRYNLRRLFRAHLVAEQTIAENIVRYQRAHPEGKLLVLLPNDAMIEPREIAAFAAQKLPLKQFILDRAQPLHAVQPQLVVIPSEAQRSRGIPWNDGAARPRELPRCSTGALGGAALRSG